MGFKTVNGKVGGYILQYLPFYQMVGVIDLRKIKIRTPKSLRLPKNTPVILVPPSLYYINHILMQEKAERQAKRQQFWADVWEGLKIVTASEVSHD